MRDRYDELFGGTERVRFVDLMGAEVVDDSDRLTEVAEGSVGAPRHLAASIPWNPSLVRKVWHIDPDTGERVRRGERPRVKNARSSAHRDSFGWTKDEKDARAWRTASARKRRNMVEPTTAAERLAILIATPRVEGPEPRPDMFGPNVRPTEGPAADLIGRPQRFAYLADAPNTYARHNADGSHAPVSARHGRGMVRHRRSVERDTVRGSGRGDERGCAEHE